MLKRYETFLSEFDKKLNQYFKSQQEYICCKKGCADCCKNGDYPFSRLEMEYLMAGFQALPQETKNIINTNIKNINNPKSYQCPFLIDNLCVLYERRGLTCRTHGLAYLENNKIKLPQCANDKKNYSKIYNPKTKEILINNPIRENLRIDELFKSAEKYELEPGEIRSLVNWFKII